MRGGRRGKLKILKFEDSKNPFFMISADKGFMKSL